VASFISVLLNIFLAFLISDYLFRLGLPAVLGLPMAFSVSVILEFFILWTILSLKINGLREKEIFLSLSKFLFSGLISAILIQIIKETLVLFVSLDTFLGVFLQLTFAGAFGILSYFLICAVLKSEELFDILDIFLSKFKKNKNN